MRGYVHVDPTNVPPCFAHDHGSMTNHVGASRAEYRFWIFLAASVVVHALFWVYRSLFDISNLSEATPIKSIEITLVSSSLSSTAAPEPPRVTPPPAKPLPSKPKPQLVKPVRKPPAVTEDKQVEEVTPLKALSEPLPGPTSIKSNAPSGPTQRAEWKSAGLQNAPAKYPESARRMDWQGRVVLRVQVLPHGVAGIVTISESSGHEILDESALEAVKRWKFIPAKRDGVPVESFVNVPINFKLKKEGE